MNKKPYKYISHRAMTILRTAWVFITLLGLIGTSGARTQVKAQPAASGELMEAAITPSIFGIEMTKIDNTNGFDKVTGANAYWLRRNGVLWSSVEPTKGIRNWSALAELDSELENAKQQGMQVILIVRSAPSWAQAVSGKPCGPIKEMDAFAEFMRDLVSRYKDRVQYWEIWNEPDVESILSDGDSYFGCWGDPNDDYFGGDQYAKMLLAVYPKIKEVDSNAQVLIGGLLLDCDPVNVCPDKKAPRFFEGILKGGGGNFFDGVSFHAYDYYGGKLGRYSNPNWNTAWNITGPVVLAKAAFIQNMLAKYNVSGKYLLNTEAALLCDSGCDAIFEATKTYYLAEVYAAAAATNLRANIWYGAQIGWRNSDLLNPDLSVRPAYHAFQFSQSRLANATFVKEIRHYAGVMGYEFVRGDRRIVVLWSMDGNNHSIPLPQWPLEVFDVDGDSLSKSNPMTVTPNPKYLEYSTTHSISLPLTTRNYHLIINGNFDQGYDDNGEIYGWTVSNVGEEGVRVKLVNVNPTSPWIDPTIPSGIYTARLGSPYNPCDEVPIGTSSVKQTFRVPDVPDGAPLRLTFKFVFYSQDAYPENEDPELYDSFNVRINNKLVFLIANRDNTALDQCRYRRVPAEGWATGEVDLTSPDDYRGQTITMSFENVNRPDHYYNTVTYLDDVRLEFGQ